jgi:hypothetical protein
MRMARQNDALPSIRYTECDRNATTFYIIVMTRMNPEPSPATFELLVKMGNLTIISRVRDGVEFTDTRQH